MKTNHKRWYDVLVSSNAARGPTFRAKLSHQRGRLSADDLEPHRSAAQMPGEARSASAGPRQT
jgi:hypothetical protein